MSPDDPLLDRRAIAVAFRRLGRGAVPRTAEDYEAVTAWLTWRMHDAMLAPDHLASVRGARPSPCGPIEPPVTASDLKIGPAGILAASGPREPALRAFGLLVRGLGWASPGDSVVFGHTHRPLDDASVTESGVRDALQRATGLPLVTSRRARRGLPPDLAVYDPDRYSKLVYSELGRLASAAIARGGVIVDATFRRASDRLAFAEGLEHAGMVLFVECRAPLGFSRSESGGGLGGPVDQDPCAFAVLDDIAEGEKLALCTVQPVAALVERVLAFLNPA